METVTPNRLKEIVAERQAHAKAGTDRLVKTFAFVPDDKVKWSPAKTSRTPFAIVAHCAMGNRMFAMMIRGEKISPMPTEEQMVESGRKFEASLANRADAVRQLEASCDEIIAALGTMTPERYASSADSPFGPIPMPFWMSLPGNHAENHAGQIDYLQTIWGDMVEHM